MRSDESGRKMLDGHIKDFCHSNPDDYGNLFWQICFSSYNQVFFIENSRFLNLAYLSE